eukprot:Nk52_evm3s352 gene=Nk52_evmTU3s352
MGWGIFGGKKKKGHGPSESKKEPTISELKPDKAGLSSEDVVTEIINRDPIEVLKRYADDTELADNISTLYATLLAQQQLPSNPYKRFIQVMRSQEQKFLLMKQSDMYIKKIIMWDKDIIPPGFNNTIKHIQGCDSIWGVEGVLKLIKPEYVERLIPSTLASLRYVPEFDGAQCTVINVIVSPSILYGTFTSTLPTTLNIRHEYFISSPTLELTLEHFALNVWTDCIAFHEDLNNVFIGILLENEAPWTIELIQNDRAGFAEIIKKTVSAKKQFFLQGIVNCKVDPANPDYFVRRSIYKQYTLHHSKVTYDENNNQYADTQSFSNVPFESLHEGVFLSKEDAEEYFQIFVRAGHAWSNEVVKEALKTNIRYGIGQARQNFNGTLSMFESLIKLAIIENNENGEYSKHLPAIYRIYNGNPGAIYTLMVHSKIVKDLVVASHRDPSVLDLAKEEFEVYQAKVLEFLESSADIIAKPQYAHTFNVLNDITSLIWSNELGNHIRAIERLDNLNRNFLVLFLQSIEDILFFSPSLTGVLDQCKKEFDNLQNMKPESPTTDKKKIKKQKSKEPRSFLSKLNIFKDIIDTVENIFEDPSKEYTDDPMNKIFQSPIYTQEHELKHGLEDLDILNRGDKVMDVVEAKHLITAPVVIAQESVLLQYSSDARIDRICLETLLDLLTSPHLETNPYPVLLENMAKHLYHLELSYDFESKLSENMMNSSYRIVDDSNALYSAPNSPFFGSYSMLCCVDTDALSPLFPIISDLSNLHVKYRQKHHKVSLTLSLTGFWTLYGNVLPYIADEIEIVEDYFTQGPRIDIAMKIFSSNILEYIQDLMEKEEYYISGIYVGSVQDAREYSAFDVVKYSEEFEEDIRNTVQSHEDIYALIYYILDWRYYRLKKQFKFHYIDEDGDPILFPTIDPIVGYLTIFPNQQHAAQWFEFFELESEGFEDRKEESISLIRGHIGNALEEGNLPLAYRWFFLYSSINKDGSHNAQAHKMFHSIAETMHYLKNLNKTMQDMITRELKHEARQQRKAAKLKDKEEYVWKPLFNTEILAKMIWGYRSRANRALCSMSCFVSDELAEVIDMKLRSIVNLKNRHTLNLSSQSITVLQEVDEYMQVVGRIVQFYVHQLSPHLMKRFELITLEAESRPLTASSPVEGQRLSKVNF